MANIILKNYIETLPHGERIAINRLLSQTVQSSEKSIDEFTSLPSSLLTSYMSRPNYEDIISYATINGNHQQIVRYLNNAYMYAQLLGELQKSCEDEFNIKFSQIESSLNQLRMELDAWDQQLANKKNFSNTISKKFNPPITLGSAGKEYLKAINSTIIANAPLTVKEDGPQYRFEAMTTSRIVNSIFQEPATGFQVQISLYLQPGLANGIRLLPWNKSGATAILVRLVAFDKDGLPITVAENLEFNRELNLTFPRVSINRILIELQQENYTISSMQSTTPSKMQEVVLRELADSVGNGYVNALFKDRFLDWELVEKFVARELGINGMSDALIAKSSGQNSQSYISNPYYRYQIGIDKIEIFNSKSSNEWNKVVVPIQLNGAPSCVTLRASDWIPDFTSVEYSIKVPNSPNLIPVPNADEKGYINEILKPGLNGICTLRFPLTMANGQMPIVYEGTRVLNNEEYEILNNRQIRLSGTLSNQSVFHIKYEVGTKENIPLPYAGNITVFHGPNGELGEVFKNTDSDNSVTLSYTPYVDKEKLGQEEYRPVNVIILGRGTEDITNWFGTSEPSFQRVPDRDTIQYIVRGNKIYFDQYIDLPITVIYEYVNVNADLVIQLMSYSVPVDSPSISAIQLSFLER